MHTYSGRKFYPLDPDVNDICLEDIAHALSLICRYGGHCPEHYSVAQHSVLVSLTCNPADAAWGVLHDGAEYVLGDMIRPLKHHPAMEAYRHAEDAVLRAICVRFGLPLVMPGSVSWADRQVLATEARDLFHTDTDGLPDRIFPWTAKESERAFLRRCRDLGIR